MIESLVIANAATYGAVPQKIQDLAKINFFFGANGAGKTTLSRLIHDPSDHKYRDCELVWKKGVKLQSLVYNRDFVDRNFNSISRLRGIFTLGEKDISALDAIEKKRIDEAEIDKKIEARKDTLFGADKVSGKKHELNLLESEAKDKFWGIKTKYDSVFSAAFKGYRNNSEKFKEQVLLQHDSNEAESKSLSYLQQRAATVFGKDLLLVKPVPDVSPAALVAHENSAVLAKKVLGKDDVDIAALINKMGSSDWVKQGRDFYEKSKPLCPFCQQHVRDDFADDLKDYFDEMFAKDISNIEQIIEGYDKDSENYLRALEAAIEAQCPYLDVEAFQALESAVTAKISKNKLLLRQKKKEPSVSVVMASLKEQVTELGTLITSANKAVAEHNEIVRNIGTEKALLISQVWRYLLDVELKDDIQRYIAKRDGIKKAVDSLSLQIQELESQKKACAEEIRALERKVTTVQPTVDGINSLLRAFGFQSFSLAKAEDGPFYKLVRADGADAKETLSEGEKSFVTFLYFFHLLKGSESESGVTADRVVVFDDPVSSLDSEVLFVVSSLIRSLFDDLRSDKGNIKQIFLLTHNVYFHKEVSYAGSGKSGEKKGDRSYWIVRRSGNNSHLEKFEQNPIKTSYELLWAELRRADRSLLTIQNTMRRILENYFKILGGVDFDRLCDHFDGRDKIICRSLLSWVNDGSHFSHDDAFFTVDASTVENYLDIFEKVFVKLNQKPHYDMMMNVPN